MERARRWLVSGGLAASVLLCSGCSDQDTERLGRIGKLVAVKFDQMTGGADGKLAHSFHAMRANWDDVALDARVLARLHWDKTLGGAQVQVTASEGTVELKGVVQDLAQRRRAVELAESTTGVESVVDSLEVRE
jgi:hypothetical protein